MILSAPTIYFRKNTLLSSENIIFALSILVFFGALQNKERERNSLVSNSFSFYYSILCFPFIISRLHPLLLLLCGGKTFGSSVKCVDAFRSALT